MVIMKLGDCKFKVKHTGPEYEVDVLVKREVNYLPVGVLIFTDREYETFLKLCFYKAKHGHSVADFIWRYARAIAA